MPESHWDNQDTLLGRLVIEQGLASAEDVHDCQEFQRELLGRQDSDGHRSLAQLLVANGLVTQRQLDRLPRHHGANPDGHQIPGFRIIRRVGSGGMATVYLAQQLSLRRKVAIKVLPRKYTDNPEFIDRLYDEGRAAAKLNHANIVGALDVGKAGDFHYFVMEYVEGRTVLDDLAQHKRYSESDALNIAVQIARALNHAHKAGLIHRDVKPKNIILTPDGVAKLADMGLARSQTDREAAEAELGKAFGTPYYISPEQIRGEVDIDFRADIYCLAATLYHMVTGRVPFEGPNPSAVMQRHLRDELVPPDHINPNLSAGVGEIIEVGMAKDRNQRYASTTSLLEDLEAVARGDAPTVARRKFNMAVLANLEPTGDTHDTKPGHDADQQTPGLAPVYAQPIFWLAVIGWGIVFALLMTLISAGVWTHMG